MAPKNWVPLTSAVISQGCTPEWDGVGLTQGVNTVGSLACGTVGNQKAHFFSPFPGVNQESKLDPEFRKAWTEFNGGSPSAQEDDLAWDLWAASKAIAQLLTAAGRNLTRQSFINAINGKQFHSGLYPDLNYAGTRFGANQVHVLDLNCLKSQNEPYETTDQYLFRKNF